MCPSEHVFYYLNIEELGSEAARGFWGVDGFGLVYLICMPSIQYEISVSSP